MKSNYARHKRFLHDVVRAVDPDAISEIASHFIPLRASPTLDFLSDVQIFDVVSRITKTNFQDVYEFLRKADNTGLTDHQIIFRIKRVKYLRYDEKENLKFALTPILSDLGTTFKNSIVIQNIEVRKMSDTKNKTEAETKTSAEEKEKVQKWILENVDWDGRDGHYNKGKMTAQEAEAQIGMSALRIRAVLRDFYKDKPVPEPREPVKEPKESKKKSSKKAADTGENSETTGDTPA